MLEMLRNAMETPFLPFYLLKSMNFRNVQKKVGYDGDCFESKQTTQNYFLFVYRMTLLNSSAFTSFKGIYSHERVPLTANTLGRWLEWLVGWLHPQECSQLYCTPGVKGCILYMCQET
jgi:hypothetical protein